MHTGLKLLIVLTIFISLPAQAAKTIPLKSPHNRPVMVIAHRGFSGIAPENTLIAFQKAIDIKADMVELDITFSKDRHIIVIHDETLDRTTNGTGKVIDYTLAQLRKLDAGSWFSPEYKGEPIPTLEEALYLLKGKILVNIEIKSEAVHPLFGQGGIEEQVVKLVEALQMEDQVIFSSFHPFAVKRIKELNPSLNAAFLYHDPIEKSPVELASPWLADAFNANRKHLTRQHFELAKKAGLSINVYTVNTFQKMKDLLSWGIDGIFTDHPDRLLKVLKELKK